MGWFFGCFGKGKKERKHGDAASLAKQKFSQKPSQTVPLRIAASASIPIKLPARKESRREDLFTVRQEMSGLSGWAGKSNRESLRLPPPLVCSSAPVRRAEGILLKDSERRVHVGSCAADSASENQNLPVGESQADPWAQLDQLEEELEDLKNQIERESQDAKKISDEVQLRKLGDPPPKTILEMKKQEKQQHREREQSPEKGQTNWHAWLSSSAKAQLEKKNENEDRQAYSCASTPTKERPGLLQSLQTPVFKSLLIRRPEIKLDSAPQAVTQAISNASQQKDTDRAVDVSAKSTSESESVVLAECAQKKLADLKGPSKTKFYLNASPDSQDLFEIRHDFLRRPDLLSFNAERRQQQPKVIAKDAFQSSLLKINDQPTTPDILQQEKCSSPDDDTETKVVANNNSAKKRRLLSAECHEESQKPKQSPPGIKADANDQAHEGIPRADSFTKRLKMFSSPDPVTAPSYREDSPLKTAGVFTIDDSNSDQRGKGNSLSNNRIPLSPTVQNRLEGRYQLHVDDSTISPSESMSYSQSISGTLGDSMQSPGSRTKSVSFTTTCYPEETTETESYGNSVTTEEVFSERDYSNNSISFEEGDDDTASAIQSCSSTASEETASGLILEHCFSPPTSPTRPGRRAVGRDEDNLKEDESASSAADQERAAQYNVSASSRYSNHRVWKQQSEFDYEVEQKAEEDDYDLFSDAKSHVSTECSDDTGSRHSVMTQFSRISRTPLKLSESMAMATPQTFGKGVAAKYPRLRTKPTSSVLIPVENLSQWNQLKEVNHDPERSSKQMEKLKQTQLKQPSPVGLILSSTAEDLKKMSCDENKGGEAAEADSYRVDTSLSHWLKPCIKPSDTKRSVETGSFKAANQSRNRNLSATSINQGQLSSSSTNEKKLILGACNSTTAYKEDQKVKWHSKFTMKARLGQN